MVNWANEFVGFLLFVLFIGGVYLTTGGSQKLTIITVLILNVIGGIQSAYQVLIDFDQMGHHWIMLVYQLCWIAVAVVSVDILWAMHRARHRAETTLYRLGPVHLNIGPGDRLE